MTSSLTTRLLVDLEAQVNSISKSSGVYALVFHLDRRQHITFSRRGSEHAFDPGWYVYVGSAHGPGGLHCRIARHRRRAEDGKRMHWNVDYFREFANLCEVWYSDAAVPEDEHRWANAVRYMRGATVPVAKFGAKDCSEGCPAHFYHFSERPWTMAFRDRLQSHYIGQSAWVEFVEEGNSQFEIAGPNVVEYQLGRQLLERRRQEMAKIPLVESKWRSMAKGQPSRLLAEEVADQCNASFEEIDKASKFATAVETIVGNCGEAAIEVLFDANRPQCREKILEISRDSDVRQQHRVDGVLSGRFRSVGRSPNDAVFDTVSFSEVYSRLSRARGSLQEFRTLICNSTSQQINAESHQLAELCLDAANILGELIDSPKPLSVNVPSDLAKPEIMSILRNDRVTGVTIGKGRGALRLIVKNVWDYHEIWRRRIRPTEEQRDRVHREIKLIRATARTILATDA